MRIDGSSFLQFAANPPNRSSSHAKTFDGCLFVPITRGRRNQHVKGAPKGAYYHGKSPDRMPNILDALAARNTGSSDEHTYRRNDFELVREDEAGYRDLRDAQKQAFHPKKEKKIRKKKPKKSGAI